MLVGQDPLDREMFWKWLWVANIPENVASVVDMALWDLAGRAAGLPVYKLLGRRPRPGQGLRQHLPQHRRAGGLRRARPGLQDARATSPTRSTRTTSGTRDRAADARPPVPHRLGHRDLPPGPRGRRRRRADVRPVGHVPHRSRRPSRSAASWSASTSTGTSTRCRSTASRATCGWPRADHPHPVAGDRRRGVFTRADWILRGASRHEPDRRQPGRHHRRAEDGHRLRGVRRQVRDPHERLRQSAGARRDVSEDTCEYYEKGLLAPGVDYDASARTCARLRRHRRRRLRHAADEPGLGYDIIWDYIDANLLDAGRAEPARLVTGMRERA